MLQATEILNASILIVDDQEANVMLLEQVLRNAGYTRITSTMDPQAVRALHQQHRYDLILLDLQMPEMDGFEVMEGLRDIEAGSYLPVLVITAQPGHKLRALQAGAKDFVAKPFDLVEVKTRIHNMLEVRLLYQKLADYNKSLELAVQERTAELRESEARFQRFTELSSDWYWEQDAARQSDALFRPGGRDAGHRQRRRTAALERHRARPARRKNRRPRTVPGLYLQPPECGRQHAIPAGQRRTDVRPWQPVCRAIGGSGLILRRASKKADLYWQLFIIAQKKS